MNHLTRFATAALCFCIPALVTISVTRGQQSGIPSSYPQTSTPTAINAVSLSGDVGPEPSSSRSSTHSNRRSNKQRHRNPAQPPPSTRRTSRPAIAARLPAQSTRRTIVRHRPQRLANAKHQVTTFNCPFERLEYVMAFGPVINGVSAPLNKNQGELTYSKPDKGSFEITKIFTYKQLPPPPINPTRHLGEIGSNKKTPSASIGSATANRSTNSAVTRSKSSNARFRRTPPARQFWMARSRSSSVPKPPS